MKSFSSDFFRQLHMHSPWKITFVCFACQKNEIIIVVAKSSLVLIYPLVLSDGYLQ